MLRDLQSPWGISNLCLQHYSQLKVKLDFINENPNLEEFYANIATTGRDDSRPRSPAWVDEPADNASSTTREDANVYSRHSSLSWTPECDAVMNQAGTAARDQSGEREGNAGQTSGYDLTKRSPTPNSHHTTLANTVNPLSWMPHAGDLPSDELQGAQNEPQVPLLIHSDYWPSMGIQEAYLMRHFIDDLGSWVRASPRY
jgi:hypothetical protein